MASDRPTSKSPTPEGREIQAAKEAGREAAKKNGRREPQEEDTPEHERPQTQKLVVDGTDG